MIQCFYRWNLEPLFAFNARRTARPSITMTNFFHLCNIKNGLISNHNTYILEVINASLISCKTMELRKNLKLQRNMEALLQDITGNWWGLYDYC